MNEEKKEKKRILVSACIIARDADLLLAKCLESVKPCVDDIVVCVDDRTKDNTVEVARQFGARLKSFTWPEVTDEVVANVKAGELELEKVKEQYGFSGARNLALSNARGKYVLIIDADEILQLQNPDALRQIAAQDNFATVMFLVLNRMPEGGMARLWSPRMFKRKDIKYRGIVHNQAVYKEPAGRSGATIVHFGYSLPPERMAQKNQRTLDLQLKAIEMEPQVMFHYANLARCYRSMERYGDSMDAATKGLTLPKEKQETHSLQLCVADFMYSALSAKEHERAIELGSQVLKEFPYNMDVRLYYAHHLLHADQYDEAIKQYRLYLKSAINEKAQPRYESLSVDTVNSEHFAWYNIGDAYAKLGQMDRAEMAYFRAARLKPPDSIPVASYLNILTRNANQRRLEEGKVRVLFVAANPCIRVAKMAIALNNGGHQVGLAYQGTPMNQRYGGIGDDMFAEIIPLPDVISLTNIAEVLDDAIIGYDVVHCHNEPDMLTTVASGMVGGEIPVIHDSHDLVSIRGKAGQAAQVRMFERQAMRLADGIIFVSPYQRRQAMGIYEIDKAKTLIIYSYIAKDWIPEEPLPKLSDTDGEMHLIYQGGLRLTGHRDYRQIFSELAASKIHVHIYPAFAVPQYPELVKDNDYLHYYDPLPPDALMLQCTQYDAGLIPLNVDETTFEAKKASLPNKLYEYLAAGLPVIARDLYSLRKFIEKHQCGILFKTTQELIAQLDSLKDMSVDDIEKFTMESQVDNLVGFYRRLMGNEDAELQESIDNSSAS